MALRHRLRQTDSPVLGAVKRGLESRHVAAFKAPLVASGRWSYAFFGGGGRGEKVQETPPPPPSFCFFAGAPPAMLRLDVVRSVSFCDGLPRRDFLHAGAISSLGLTLPGFLAAKTQA